MSLRGWVHWSAPRLPPMAALILDSAAPSLLNVSGAPCAAQPQSQGSSCDQMHQVPAKIVGHDIIVLCFHGQPPMAALIFDCAAPSRLNVSGAPCAADPCWLSTSEYRNVNESATDHCPWQPSCCTLQLPASWRSPEHPVQHSLIHIFTKERRRVCVWSGDLRSKLRTCDHDQLPLPAS